MKKIITALIIFLSLILTNINTYAISISLDNKVNNETIQIHFSTKEITLPYVNDCNYIYSNNYLQKVKENTFFIVNPSNNSIALYDKSNNLIKTIDLIFVNPDVLTLKIIDDKYYPIYNDNIIYGTFDWLVDNKEVKANYVTGDNVILNYNGQNIILETNETSIFEEYIVYFLGAPILLFIIIYIIYLLFPKNIYKKIYKASIKIKNKLNKNNINYKKAIFILKLSLPNLNNLVLLIESDEPYIKAFKKVNSDLNLMLDNINNLDGFYPEDDINGLINYVNRKLDVYIRITEEGKRKLPKKDLSKIKIKVPTLNNELDKSQEDSLHYLESIKVINKDNK